MAAGWSVMDAINRNSNPDAERICDEICQKIYDLRISVGGKK